MGSKDKTFTEYYGQPLFEPTDNLFIQEMIRVYGKNHSTKPFAKTAVIASNFYFNEKVFKRMGVITENVATISGVTYNSVQTYCRNLLSPTSIAILYKYFWKDDKDKIVQGDSYRIEKFLDDSYSKPTIAFTKTHTEWFYNAVGINQDKILDWDYDVSVCPDCGSSTNTCDGQSFSPEYLYNHWKVNTGGDVNDPQPYTNSFSVWDINGTYRTMGSANTNIDPQNYPDDDTVPLISENSGVYYINLNKVYDNNGVWTEDTNDTIQVALPVFEDILYAVAWASRPTDDKCLIYECNSNCGFNPNLTDLNGDNYHYGLEKEITMEANTDKFLIIPIKKDNTMCEDNKYQTVLMANFGLNNGDMTTSLQNTDIEHCFIGYADNIEQTGKFYNFLLDKYGNENDTKEVIFQDYYDIRYYWQNKMGGGLEHKVRIGNDIDTIEETDKVFLLPMSVFKGLKLKEKYDFYRDYITIVMLAKQTVHLKWYQTKMFKVVMLTISLGVSIATGNPTAFALALSSNIIADRLEKIDPNLAKAFKVAVILYGAYNSGGLTFTNVATTTVQFSNMYFSQKIKEIQESAEKYNRETRDMAKIIEEQQEKGMFYQVDFIQDYYDNVYEIGFDYESSFYPDMLESVTKVADNNF